MAISISISSPTSSTPVPSTMAPQTISANGTFTPPTASPHANGTASVHYYSNTTNNPMCTPATLTITGSGTWSALFPYTPDMEDQTVYLIVAITAVVSGTSYPPGTNTFSFTISSKGKPKMPSATP
jgi:hypothetical protein